MAVPVVTLVAQLATACARVHNLSMPAETVSAIGSVGPVQFQEVCVCIGGLSLALSGISSDEVRLSPELEAFQNLDEKPDIEIEVAWVDKLQRLPCTPVFDSGALWTLFLDGGEYIFDFTSAAFSFLPYKRLRARKGFRTAQLVLSREALCNHRPVFPLEYPTDELMITNYLASGTGVEVHGCGLVDPDTGGHLFLGHSGSGKSTTARIWETFRSPQILSDDRIILRLHDGELWMYGTPWHGEAAFASPARAKLERIHILRQGSENRFSQLSKARAVGEVFARSFPPFHSQAGLERTLEFIKRALDAVPCYEFAFLPDSSSVAAVLEAANHD
jgi:hypothetical protein